MCNRPRWVRLAVANPQRCRNGLGANALQEEGLQQDLRVFRGLNAEPGRLTGALVRWAMCSTGARLDALLRGDRLTDFALLREGAKRNRLPSCQTWSKRADSQKTANLSHQETLRALRFGHLVMANVLSTSEVCSR